LDGEDTEVWVVVINDAKRCDFDDIRYYFTAAVDTNDFNIVFSEVSFT
jgi:hypothetical protein